MSGRAPKAREAILPAELDALIELAVVGRGVVVGEAVALGAPGDWARDAASDYGERSLVGRAAARIGKARAIEAWTKGYQLGRRGAAALLAEVMRD